MINSLALLLAGLLVNFSLFADEPVWHYTLINDTAIQLNNSDVQKFRNVLLPELDWDLNDSLRLRAEARLLWDPEFEDWKKESEFRELALDWEGDETSIRAGLQQVVWGQASGFLSSFDVFHPQDRREWVLPAFEFMRRPLWMAQLQQPVGEWTLEALWSPEEKVNRSAEVGTSYYLSAPPLPTGFSIINAEDDRDRQRFGLRLSTSYDSWDLAFIYLSVPQNKAVFSYEILSESQLKRTARYKRYNVTGLSFSRAMNTAVLRGELSYYLDREIQTRGVPGVGQSDQSNFVLGIDMTVLTDLDMTFEVGRYHLVDYKGSFIEPENTTRVLFQIRKPFQYETLVPRLAIVSDLEQGNMLIRPALQWNVTDQFSMTAGLDIINGDGKPFSQFGETDRFYLSLEYRQ